MKNLFFVIVIADKWSILLVEAIAINTFKKYFCWNKYHALQRLALFASPFIQKIHIHIAIYGPM